MDTITFRKKYPRLYKHILKTYDPVFDIFVAIDYYLKGVKPPVCSVCSNRVQVAKSHPTRCKKCINVGDRYTHDALAATLPLVNIIKFDNILKPTDFVEVDCNLHGVHTVSIRTLLKNKQCGKCLTNTKAKDTSEDIAKLIIEFSLVHGDTYDYSSVISTTGKVDIICKQHGKFTQSVYSHKKGHGCSLCANEKQKLLNKEKFTTEKFVDKAEKKHNNSYTYGNTAYDTATSKVTITCIKHGDFEQVANYHLSGNGCQKCAAEMPNFTSAPELELKEFLESNGVKVIPHHYIDGVQFDLYVPDHNFCIEYDGLYWHSSGSRAEDKKMERLHINKTDICEKYGMKLYHIWENEWLLRQDLWKSMLLSACNQNVRIPARKCRIATLQSRDVSVFCDKNHMQGYCGAKHTVGLYYGDELVSMMSFSAPRYNRNIDYELIRFCSKRNTTVMGAFSKMFKHFMSTMPPNTSVISYANRRWSNGNTYAINGGTLNNITEPCYFYWLNKTGNYKLEHRSVYQKHKLEAKLELYEEKMTEVDNMYNNRFRRIWDCGTKVYIWNKHE